MPKNGSRFVYQQRTKDDIKERANNRGGNFDSIFLPQFKIYKVREGKNVLRILPPTWEKPKHYGFDIWVNYGIGADNQSYLSLAKMKNQKDPIAEARVVASRDGDDALARALQARQRILMWVIDRNAEDEGPQLWPAAFTVDKDLASLSFDDDTKEVSYIDDPDNGRDFRFYKEGEGLKTKYPAAKMKLLAESPLSDDPGLAEEWLEYVAANPLPDCLQFYDYEHIAQVFDGHARVEPEDDAAPVRPARRIVDPDEDKDVPAEPRPRPRLAPVEEEAKPPAVQSIRERLRARQTAAPKSPEPDEDD
jgi:hypothetical protein